MDLAPSYRISPGPDRVRHTPGLCPDLVGGRGWSVWAVPRPAGADSDPAIYRQRSGYLSGRKADSPFPLRRVGVLGNFLVAQCPFCFIFGEVNSIHFFADYFQPCSTPQLPGKALLGGCHPYCRYGRALI